MTTLSKTQEAIEQRGRAFADALLADGIRAAVCIVAIGKDVDADDAAMAHIPIFNATDLETAAVADQLRAQAEVLFQQAFAGVILHERVRG